jgi:hypothetical protein
MRRFKSTAEPLVDEVMVNDEVPYKNCQKPALAVDDNGNICIAWADSAYAFVQFYDSDGEKLGHNNNTGIRLGDYTSSDISFRDVSVATIPGGGFVVYGTDYSNSIDNPDVSAIYYHSDGTRWSRKTQVSDPDQFSFNYQVANYNSVAVGGDRIVYVWQDNRRHKGWDIYAKIYDLDITGIEEPPVTLPPSTNLEIASSVGQTITLRYSDFPEGFSAAVYDASGRKVDYIKSTLESGTITWGSHQSPGVYFIVPQEVKAKPVRVVLVK